MNKCKVCGDPLIKEERTEHYGCRNIKVLSKKGVDDTCSTRFISAVKALDRKPGLFERFFGITL